MPGPYITADDLKQRVADMLNKSVGDLGPRWDRIAAAAVAAGYADITGGVNGLLAKGFTIAQVDAWADRVSVSEDQSLYRAGLLAAGLGSYDTEAVKQFDHRTELAAVTALPDESGTAMYPAAGESDVGGIAYGRSDARADLEAWYDGRYGRYGG
jgi:hypothetical protein